MPPAAAGIIGHIAPAIFVPAVNVPGHVGVIIGPIQRAAPFTATRFRLANDTRSKSSAPLCLHVEPYTVINHRLRKVDDRLAQDPGYIVITQLRAEPIKKALYSGFVQRRRLCGQTDAGRLVERLLDLQSRCRYKLMVRLQQGTNDTVRNVVVHAPVRQYGAAQVGVERLRKCLAYLLAVVVGGLVCASPSLDQLQQLGGTLAAAQPPDKVRAYCLQQRGRDVLSHWSCLRRWLYRCSYRGRCPPGPRYCPGQSTQARSD